MKCLICEKELEEKTEEELCETCKEFFLSQSKKELKTLTEQFRESQEYLKEWRSKSDEKEVEE